MTGDLSTTVPQGPGGFTLGPLIGQSGTARVYRATHLRTSVEVALKVWRVPTSTLDDDARGRFTRECQVLYDLSQRTDRVVGYRGSGLSGGRPWLAMDLYESSLADVVRQGPLPVERVLVIADDVLTALVEIHAAGHLHRDLTPGHVLLRDGRAVLGAFGIGLDRRDPAQDVAAGFLAPELLAGGSPSPRSDLYCLGRTLRAALRPVIPAGLETLLARATSADPAQRPADAASFKAALARLTATRAPDTGQVPTLRVTVAGHPHRLGPGRQLMIGRGREADVDVQDPQVSRRHALLRQAADGGWEIADVGSTNGLWHAGARIQRLSIGRRPVTVQLGGSDGVPVSITPVLPEATAAPADAPRVVRIGRARSNHLVLPDLLVSRQHAELELTPSGPQLSDLGSGNGTYVNGRAIDRRILQVGDHVSIGPHRLRFDGATLVEVADADDVELSVAHLSVDVDADHRILDDVSFSLQPRTLMAVVGPSGAGKSTLLHAVAGLQRANHGTVLYTGRDLYAEYDELRQRIGFVPQQDTVHLVLTVRQALGYAARLRFPADTSEQERAERVREVAAELSLTDRLDTRISRLSGGERKRASMALELLTKPPLLFLDEPTSGLDADLDRDVMRRLRALADDGRTVIVVTHNLDHLAECDLVMVLARGGHLAYLGPPREVFGYFEVASWADLFGKLKEHPGAAWADRFRRWPGRDPRAVPPVLDRPGPATAPPEADPPPRRSPATQWLTLIRRQLAVIAADRVLLAILTLTPVVLALIARVIPANQGLARIHGNLDAMQLLLVLCVGAALAGAAGSVRELAKERALYHRERAVGLSTGAYLAAKVVVFTTVGALQGALLTVLAMIGRPTADQALVLGHPTLEVAVVVAVVAAVSAVYGLAISAVVRDENQAMPLLVLLTMAQLVMCGGLVPIDGRAGLEQLSWSLPCRWSFAAAASTVDLRFLQQDLGNDPLWAHTAGTWLLDVAVLLGLGLAAVGLTAVLLRRGPGASRR